MEPGLRVRAEQALLGAVLSDPQGQQHVLDWMRPGDMYRPYHGQVLAAMLRLRDRGVVPGPLAVHEELARDPDLPEQVARDGARLAGLMGAAPQPRHAPSYAGIVVEERIRDQVHLAGSRLAQAADRGNIESAMAAARRARQQLEACRARWQTLPESVRRDLPVPARDDRDYAETARRARAVRNEIGRLRENLWAEPPERLQERLAAIAQQLAETVAASATMRERQAQDRIAREARPAGPDAEAAGRRALRDLAAGPDQLDMVGEWLRPGHFARADHGELYRAMREMRTAGKPIDPLTLAHEAARRGIQADPADLSGGTGVFADAKRVSRGSTRIWV
jgi:replicative DNA helicase